MKVGSPSLSSTLRFGIPLIIMLMVISSPVVMLANPVTAAAAAAPSLSTYDAAYAANAPSTIGQDGKGDDFTTQAALSLTRASQTSNFVSSKAYYDIMFRTTTAGAIKTVEIDFPPGTYVGAASLVEVVGLGPGTIAASGSTATGMKITYTVTNAVNVPAFTNIRIQLSNINNPPNPSASFTVSITTRNAANGVIDGPTSTSAYNMVQVSNAQIANGAVTNSKIANNAISTGRIADGAVTTSKIADGSITGEKIDGIDKLVFGTCTGTIPAMTIGQGLDAEGFSCPEPLAEVGDQVVGMVDDNEFGVPFPVLFNVQNLIGQVFFWFTSPYDEGTGTHTGVEVSYILFKKP